MSRRSLIVALLAVAALHATGSGVHAAPTDPVTGLVARMLDVEGDPMTRAGAYPDRIEIEIDLDRAASNLKDLAIELPRGFAGSPDAATTCPRRLMSVHTSATCPSTSQIGVGTFDAGFLSVSTGLYRIDSDSDHQMTLGFKVLLGGGVSGRIFVDTLPDGRSRISVGGFIQDGPAIAKATFTLWGIPADHQSPDATTRKGLFAPSTRCDGSSPTVTVQARSWQEPDVWYTRQTEMGPPLVGCDALPFAPRADFALDRGTTDSPSGARVGVTLPQNDDPDGVVTAHAKAVSVRLPEGVALSPAAAEGLTACPEEVVGLGRRVETGCPASSKVGTAELSSPLLAAAVNGAIYLGRQQSATDYRLYVVLRGPAIDIKLSGLLHADAQTGQLTAGFSDLPELPFERLTLDFTGGERAPLATPLTCGARTATVTLAPYRGGPAVASSVPVTVGADPSGRPCPAQPPFAPTFVAGTSTPRAGAAGPLAITIRRAPGEQLLGRLVMKLPEGVSARLASVERCRAAAAAAGACPPSSRIGAAIVEAGSGPSPFAMEGDIFLTGPYRRAPFGMALVFRAIAGPFDLGTIVVRAALRVDPLTGQVEVETDRLPQVASGIPLRLQMVALDIDRPGFMINPTSCAPSRVSAAIGSAGGATSHSRSRFAVGGCEALRFGPRIAAALIARSKLRKGGHPGLRLRLRSSARGANLRRLSIDLPKLLAPSVTGPNAICSLTQLEDDRCPAASSVGRAFVRTPILSKPLRGSMYMTQPPQDGLADVWTVVRGMGVSIRFRMKTVLRKDGRLRGRIVGLPDIPLSRLTLAFSGGKRGMFSATRRPCRRGRARPMVARMRLVAHSVAKRRRAPRIRVRPGCSRRDASRRSPGRRR